VLLSCRRTIRTRALSAAFVTVSAVTVFAAKASAGKLSRASEAAHGSSPPSSSSSSQSSRESSESCCQPAGPVDELAAVALLYVVGSPWIVPNAIVEAERPEGSAGRTRFAEYPYAHDSGGFLLQAPLPPAPPPDDDDGIGQPEASTPPPVPPPSGPTSRKSVGAFLGLEAGIGTNDAVIRSGFHAQVMFPYRLGLDTSWSWYREASGEGADQLGGGREHLTIRFAESRRVYFESGIGPQHLVDSRGWVNGVDVTWGFRAFPGRPVVLAAQGSLGNLGPAFAPGARGEIGFMLDRFEISAGFEERWVGPVALGGPFVSVTAWL